MFTLAAADREETRGEGEVEVGRSRPVGYNFWPGHGAGKQCIGAPSNGARGQVKGPPRSVSDAAASSVCKG
jgi:hypothetical protein